MEQPDLLCTALALNIELLSIGPEENHQPAASHLQTLFHNVVLNTPHLNRIQTHNVSGDRHRLHR
jgi:hypothetical protein